MEEILPNRTGARTPRWQLLLPAGILLALVGLLGLGLGLALP